MDDDSDDLNVSAEIELFEDYEELYSLRTIELLRDVIETAEKDDSTSEVIISSTTARGLELVERFLSLDELREFLEQFGWETTIFQGRPQDSGIFGYGGRDQVSRSQVASALDEAEATQLFEQSLPSNTSLFRVQPGLLIPELRLQLANVNEELIRYLAAHPTALHTLDSRLFEELIGELFRDLGYEVIVTPRSRDGGVDIRAVHKSSVGTLLYLIECKRYAPERPVGVEIVRALYGVAAAERASCAVLATTSYFTNGAKEFAKAVEYQFSLRDYADLNAWLRQYPTAGKSR